MILGQLLQEAEQGDGITQNDHEALKWFRLAAKQKHLYAQATIGYMHHHGLGGLPENHGEAVKWLRKRDSTSHRIS